MIEPHPHRVMEEAERFYATQQFFSKMAPGTKITFDNAMYLSEANTADRNFALAHYIVRRVLWW